MEGGGQLPLTASASADGRRFNFLFVAVGSALDEVTVVPQFCNIQNGKIYQGGIKSPKMCRRIENLK